MEIQEERSFPLKIMLERGRSSADCSAQRPSRCMVLHLARKDGDCKEMRVDWMHSA